RAHHHWHVRRPRGEIGREPLILRVIVAVATQPFAVVRDEVHAAPVEGVVERSGHVEPGDATGAGAAPVAAEHLPLARLARPELAAVLTRRPLGEERLDRLTRKTREMVVVAGHAPD